MKKNKTKSLLICATMAGVVAGGMPSVQAAQVNAIVGPKDFASLKGKQTVFGRERGYVEYRTVNVYNQKPTWQIVDVNTGGISLLAVESWGKNRVSDTAVYHESLNPGATIKQYHYVDVLNYLEINKNSFFTQKELALLGMFTIVEKTEKMHSNEEHEYRSVFSLPSSESLNGLTAAQRKRGAPYWLSDSRLGLYTLDGAGQVEMWYNQGSIDVNGNYQEVRGENVRDYYPLINISKELVFAYYGTKYGQWGPSFERIEANDREPVRFAFRDTVNEHDVSVDNLVVTGNQIQFSVDGLVTGRRQELSGILEDSNGSYVSYARLVRDAPSRRIDNVQIYKDSNRFVDNAQFAPGEYTLHIFNENLSGEVVEGGIIDYVGNFFNLGKILLDGNGVIERWSMLGGSNIPNLSVDKIKKLSISGDRTFSNLSVGKDVDFVHPAQNKTGEPHGSYWSVDCEALKVTNKLNWTGVLDAEGTIELKGIFSVNDGTLTLVRPTNTEKKWTEGISGWNDIIYSGTAGQNATLYVNGNMHGLTVNGGTFIAEKSLTLADYLQVKSGATAKINGDLQAANVLLSENGRVGLGNGKTIRLSNGLTMNGGSSISGNGGTGILQFNNADFMAKGAVSFNNVNFAGTVKKANFENTTIQFSGAGNNTMVSDSVDTKGTVELNNVNLETNDLSVDGTLKLQGNLNVKKILNVQNDKADSITVNNLVFGEGTNIAGGYYFDLGQENFTVTGKVAGTVKLNINYNGSWTDNSQIDVFTGTGDLTDLRIQPARVTDRATKKTFFLTQDAIEPGKVNVNIAKHNTAINFADGVVAGQKVYFGSYWQSDTNGDGKVDKTDDKQKILWDVVGDQNGVVTLFSEKVLHKSVRGNAGTSAEMAIASFKENFDYRHDMGVWLRDVFSEGEAKLFDYKLDAPTLDEVKEGGTFNLTAEQRRASGTAYSGVSTYGLANAYEARLILDFLKDFRLIQIDNNGNVIQSQSERKPKEIIPGLRPVMRLDGTKSVLFATNAENGKGSVGVGGYTRLKRVDNHSTLELTLDDAYVHLYTGQERKTGDISIDRIMLNVNSVQLRYSGAKYVDDNSYISYFVGDGDLSQDYLGYGKSEVVDKSGNGFVVVRLKDITDANDTNGYALTLFNEYDKGTSMAGALNVVPGSFTTDSNGNVNYTIKGNAILPDLIVGYFNKLTATDGTLTITKRLTVNGIAEVDKIRFAGGSTLEVDGNEIKHKAAITYTTGVWAADNSKLIIKNQKEGVEYKIVEKRPTLLMSNGPSLGSPAPNGGDGYADDLEDWEKIVWPAYGLVLDHDASVFDEERLTLTFEEDPNLSDYSDMSNIVGGLLSEPEGMAWIEKLSYELAFWPEADIEMYLELLNNSVNTLANINTLANVQGGVSAISSFAGNSIQSNICTGSRPMLGNRSQGAALRNVAANTKDSITQIDVVEQGRADKVMPEQYDKDKYEREVWASFIHNKEKIENRKTGHLNQNNTMQYNGTVVGADLWSGKHGFGGMALTYGNGNTNSGQMISNVKNEADYYGINVYNRQDVGKYSFVYDGGFTYGKNELTLSILGEEDVTAKPKVRAYTMGFKVEEPIKISNATEITPFMGARYTFVKTKKYKNSLEVGYDIDNQHLINMPIGLTIKGMYETKEGWKLGGTVTAGYSWNLGNREGRQKVSFGGYSDMIDFDIADKGEYFVRPTLLAEKENLTFEVGYDYSKGKTTRSNKWYVNMNFRF